MTRRYQSSACSAAPALRQSAVRDAAPAPRQSSARRAAPGPPRNPARIAALAAVLLGLSPAAAVLAGDSEPQAGGAPAAVLDAVLPGARVTQPLDALVERAALPAGERVRVVEVGRDAHTSHHLVSIRDRETLHRHARHDLIVVILRGHGRMHVDGAARPVGRGSVLYVPRGTAHAFENTSAEPATAYVIYTPPFDGEDRVPAGGVEPG